MEEEIFQEICWALLLIIQRFILPNLDLPLQHV